MIEYIIIKCKEAIKKNLIVFEECFPNFVKQVHDIDKYAEKLAEHATVVLQTDNGEVIGFSAFYENDTIAHSGYISLIGVLSKYRRTGKGTELMNFVLNKMKQSGMKKVRLEVDKQNIIAQQYYIFNGFSFEEMSREDNYFMFKIL